MHPRDTHRSYRSLGDLMWTPGLCRAIGIYRGSIGSPGIYRGCTDPRDPYRTYRSLGDLMWTPGLCRGLRDP